MLPSEPPRSCHKLLFGSKNPLIIPATAVVNSSIFGLIKLGSKRSPSFLTPFQRRSAIVLPRPSQSLFLNAATIRSAIPCAWFSRSPSALSHTDLYWSSNEVSALSSASVSPGLIPEVIPVEPVLPEPPFPDPVDVSLVGAFRTFNSSNPRIVRLSSSAFSAAVSRAFPASSAASATSPSPSEASSSPRSANASLRPPTPPSSEILTPSSFASHVKSRCNAMTRPLIYGSTFWITGRKMFPIILARVLTF